MLDDIYAVEKNAPDQYQSVFPEQSAELSQLHSTVDDAVAYIREVSGDVEITLPLED